MSMGNKLERYELSIQDKVRRSLYEVLRDQLDLYLIKHALIDSYWKFIRAEEPYPFVQKRELKPRARGNKIEFPKQNSFLVIFCEGLLPSKYKKYIRFFDTNKVSKKAVNEIANIDLSVDFSRNIRHFDNPEFESLLHDLLPHDYALLIQQDPSIKSKIRYVLSHFHVKIDWLIDDATEEMAKELRYISKSLYENGERYAQTLHQKLFEKYGFHYSVGGRRTAAVVVSQFLEKMDFFSTVYVCSSEARALTRISEQGVTRFILLPLMIPEIANLIQSSNTDPGEFEECFLVDKGKDYGVCIFQVTYSSTEFARPPGGGEPRKLQPDYNWLTVDKQLIVPLPDQADVYPVHYKTIYASD